MRTMRGMTMPETGLRPRGADKYLAMLQAMLPQGMAWNRLPLGRGSTLTALLAANADELARLDLSMRLLLDEADPQTTVQGLEDWERVLGLPDECLPAGNTLQERRAAVLQKLRDEGRQDLAYWYGVAESLGYDVTIEEHWPFQCGIHECGDPSGLDEREAQLHTEIGYLGEESMRWWWNVIVHGDRVLWFRCGESAPPESLCDWRSAATLECIMRRDKLAHTLLTFEYLSE